MPLIAFFLIIVNVEVLLNTQYLFLEVLVVESYEAIV